MTTNELIDQFNTEFGLNEWPQSYEIDAETYAHVCQSMFNWAIQNDTLVWNGNEKLALIYIALGGHNGIMFKNVELILRGWKE